MFGLLTARFIFNLFGEGFHWILVSYLRWTFVHYLDDFVAVFLAVQTTDQRMKWENRAYNWITDLLGIPRNESKDGEGIQITVFGIEIDTSTFITRLLAEKLDKAVKATAKILTEKFVRLLKI